MLAMLLILPTRLMAASKPALQPLPPTPVEFKRDILPLLEQHCLECHSAGKQKGGFKLTSRESAFKGGENFSPAIVAGDAQNSPLIRIVSGEVTDLRMPPKGAPLSAGEIQKLRSWIDQGAPWEPSTASTSDDPTNHWAFRPVARPTPPTPPRQPGAVVLHNPIDAFIASKLGNAKLTLSPEADRITLIRRLYLTLLGLPPSPEDVERFVRDSDPNAFERLVDRVLADSRYGERWGRHWLDVVRFAESNGFETNRERVNAWKFRDYVIAAFNQDKPYDQFIREQIAGDQFGADVGTGFLVGGPFDIVKSPDPVLTAQQRADELDDMVSTTGTAFLGLTLGCARCHSHKFDPVSQSEYYSMAAIFAGVQHGDRSLKPSMEAERELAAIDAKIAGIKDALNKFKPLPAPASPTRTKRPPVDPAGNEDALEPVTARFLRFSIRATTGGEVCIDELEVWSGTNNVALARKGTKATASGSLRGYEIHKLEHINDGQYGNNHSWISDTVGSCWVELEFPKPERIDRISWARDRDRKFGDRLAIDYTIDVAMTRGDWHTVASAADREPFKGIETKPKAPEYAFDRFPPAEAEEGRRLLATLDQLSKARSEAARTPAVWAGTFSQPGLTYRLHRGDPMQNRDIVSPGTLAIFNPLTLSTNSPEMARRRQLAEWISSPGNPLTARVIVNRLWQYQFGVGLVDTPNDFGRNGAKPSHPELLDWLACELIQPSLSPSAATQTPAWSLKHIQRLIVTSATWRQSSAPLEEARGIDSSSRLLWRFPPRRLEAEAIRDSILSVCGNLDATAGGPSFFLHAVDRENVYHYHPKSEFGPAENRRMIYAFKVRMEQDGIFGAFDCPDGSLVMPKRSVSTTPLQALNLFNSQFILQQSDIFARRLERECGPVAQSHVRRAWHLAYNRAPNDNERIASTAFVQAHGLQAFCRAILNSNEFLFIP